MKKEKQAGVVTHYFDKIKVAVVKLSTTIAAGDNLRFAGGEETDFTQTVKSMQSEHEKIVKAGKGKEVGIKVKEKVRDGYKVYKI